MAIKDFCPWDICDTRTNKVSHDLFHTKQQEPISMPQTKLSIYLDMHGVCWDFISEAISALGLPIKHDDWSHWNAHHDHDVTN
jgi:hypothetical protein